MKGRLRPKHEHLAKLVTDVSELNKYSHLKEIAQKLLDVLNFVSVSELPDEEIDKHIKYIESIISLLPQPKGHNNRFLFDAHMIESLREKLEETSKGLSRMILPSCGEEWSHRIIYLPFFVGDKIPRVDLINFRGESQLYDVVFLDYPWLYHELGHIILYEYQELFIASFKRVLNNVSKGLKARSLGDSPINKKRAEDTIEKLRSFWGVDNDPWSWAIEIGSDVIALWTCGPAFLEAFEKELDKQNPNPYLISNQHPPYEIRCIGLMDTGSKLGLSKYIATLKDKVKLWKTSSFGKDRTNEYVSYANKEILDGAISSALKVCANLSIPVCDQNKVKEIEYLVKGKEKFDFGAELIIAAWLISKKVRRDDYDSWERETLEALNKNIRQ